MNNEKKDWLNIFFEKNAWGIGVAIIGLVAIFVTLQFQVDANTHDIETWEEAMVEVVQLQKDIIELQTNQKNASDDIAEIKEDVKTLLIRK